MLNNYHIFRKPMSKLQDILKYSQKNDLFSFIEIVFFPTTTTQKKSSFLKFPPFLRII